MGSSAVVQSEPCLMAQLLPTFLAHSLVSTIGGAEGPSLPSRPLGPCGPVEAGVALHALVALERLDELGAAVAGGVIAVRREPDLVGVVALGPVGPGLALVTLEALRPLSAGVAVLASLAGSPVLAGEAVVAVGPVDAVDAVVALVALGTRREPLEPSWPFSPLLPLSLASVALLALLTVADLERRRALIGKLEGTAVGVVAQFNDAHAVDADVALLAVRPVVAPLVAVFDPWWPVGPVVALGPVLSPLSPFRPFRGGGGGGFCSAFQSS